MNIEVYLWPISGFSFGVALGLLFVGYLIKPAIRHWDSTAGVQNLFFGVICFLLGGGGGAMIFSIFSKSVPWYLFGVAIGIIWGCMHAPKLIGLHTLETVKQVVILSDALSQRITNLTERATVILSILAPPISTNKSSDEVETALNAGLDSYLGLPPDVPKDNLLDEQGS